MCQIHRSLVPSLFVLGVMAASLSCNSKPLEKETVETLEIRSRAEKGNPQAQLDLGTRYELGYNVPRNHGEALKWYRAAAQQGNVEAAFKIGALYQKRHVVARDLREAASWYLKAAEQGHAEAQASLGSMYEKGQGVLPNNIEAYKWYSLSAKSPLDCKRLAALMTPEELAEAEKRVRSFTIDGRSSK